MSLKLAEKEKLLLDAKIYYHDNALAFVQDAILLNVKDKYQITWQQEEALKAIPHHNKIGIRSGHGPGKTAFLSMEIWRN